MARVCHRLALGSLRRVLGRSSWKDDAHTASQHVRLLWYCPFLDRCPLPFSPEHQGQRTKAQAAVSSNRLSVLVQAAGSRVPVLQAQVRTPEHGSSTRSEGHSLMLHAGLRGGGPLPRECPQHKGRGVSPTASPKPPCCVYYLRLLPPPFPPLLFLPLPSLFLSACS